MADELFTRDEALGGLPARRAATLLFLIENRSAHLEARSRLEAEEFSTEKAAEELDLAFIEAFALSREPPLRVTIQDLERHAAKWAHLIPENARLRAAIAHLLCEKYSFTSRDVPGIRSALGLDQPAVQRAYQGLYDGSVDAIFAPRVTLIERLRWVSTAISKRLDLLPPFWTTFLLVTTLSLPQAVLALPIAVSGLGALAGVALLLFFGLINVLTMACMAEAFARNGSIQYGGAFTGRVVSDYVGAAGSRLLISATATRLFIGLLACYYGLSVTMAGLTAIRPSVWAALLFLLALYLLADKSLNFSTALSASLGAISISLIFVIALASLGHVQRANLSYVNVPFLFGRPFERGILQVIFGIVIQSYLGHSYLTQCAKVVLPRDPGGRSLIWGTAAASGAITLLLCAWILVINGALAPSLLAGQSGTVLAPLANQIGSHLNISGFLLVILLLGLAFIRQSTVLFNLARELIPARPQATVVLPRRRASLLFVKRGRSSEGPSLGLTYLGLSEGQPLFRLDIQLDGKIQRFEMTVDKNWDVSALLERMPELRPYGISVALQVADAHPDSARLRVTSTMNLKYDGEWVGTGLHIADVGTLRDPLRQLINWINRQGEVTLAEVTRYVGGNEWVARLAVDELSETGFVQRLEAADNPRYRVHVAARRGRQLPPEIWRSLDDTAPAPQRSRPITPKPGFHPMALRFRQAMMNPAAGFFLSISPIIMVFAVTEWLVLTGTSSFTGILAVCGLLANSLVGGVFPVLLLVSSRRKGDLVPKVVIKLLGRPVVLAGIYSLFVGTLLLHATVIWVNPAERAAAFLVVLLALAATAAMARQGAFSPRIVVELKEETRQPGKKRAVFAVTANGEPAVAEVQMSYAGREEKQRNAAGEVPAFDDLRSVTFHLPATGARELKVWAHTVTPDGSSQSLPAIMELQCGGEAKRFDLKLSGGKALVPITGDACRLQIAFAAALPA